MVKIGKRLGLYGREKEIVDGDYLWSRRRKVKLDDVGKTVYVYNGQGFRELFIEEAMVGHKYGEYILTKRIGGVIHKKKDKKRR